MVSIIIPCHNSARWIEPTLESVYAQTYADWELLLVDDGSTDDTLSILRRHEARDERVRVLSQTNGGVSVARNNALENARGEYLMFVDSDDLIPPFALTLLTDSLLRNDADISEGSMVNFHTPAEAEKYMEAPSGGYAARCAGNPGRERLLSGEEAAAMSLYQNGVSASMSAKVYRKELFAGIQFPPGEIYEDLSVFYRVALRARRLVSLPDVVYLYRQRPDSQIHTFNPGRLVVLEVTRRIERHMADMGNPPLLRAARDRRLSAAFNMLGLLLNESAASCVAPVERDAYIAECMRIIRDYSPASLAGRGVRLKNRFGALLGMILPAPLLKALMRRQYQMNN